MIDWARVADLRSEIGAEDFAEVIVMFLEETDEVIDRIAAQGDSIEIERDLHFLKGSALNLGFQDLAQLCNSGERAAAAGQGAAVDMAQIVACYRASKNSFQKGLDQQTAA